MRLRLLAAVAAVLVFAGLAPAQSYFVPYTTSSGGQAGQLLGVPNNLFEPAVKVGGVVTELPQPADWYGFAYCLSANATTSGGYSYLPDGRRLATVWVHDGSGWVMDRAFDFTPRGYFFAYPYAAYNDGSVLMMGYTYSGRVEYFVW